MAARRAGRVLEILERAYPDARCGLAYGSPLQLLVATILSAQCTDRQVNQVTGPLFERFPTPRALAEARPADVEKLVHSTGFYKNKARNIRACAAALLERHGGEVPAELEALVALPGVGRKTANVVLGAAFGIPGVVVDTHVARISRRLAFTAHTDPVKIEFDLMAVVPKRSWNVFGLHLIYFGRDICTARKPACHRCPVERHCPYPDKNLSA